MNTKLERPYIDFYTKHKISPVAQDISDLKKHYDRREFLYRRLGIPASFVKDKSVIEFGSGSGHNALYTYNLRPSKYVLVDGNRTGLKECEKLLAEFFPDSHEYQLVESLIEHYVCNELFDLVLCEGVIPAQKNPRQFLKRIAQFTKPKGICVITCHDAVSYISESLRCLIGLLVTEEDISLEKKVNILLTVFTKHLSSLIGMSRSHKDWILDNILNVSWCRDSRFLSIAAAIETLSSSFDVYGSSPYIFTDWRWYKDVHGDERKFNEIGVACYRTNLHNLLDYRYTGAPRSSEENETLHSLCVTIRRLIASYSYVRDRKLISEIDQKISELEATVRLFNPITADALLDFNNTLKCYPDITPQSDWGRFVYWWGRGMQYLSFIRHGEE